MHFFPRRLAEEEGVWRDLHRAADSEVNDLRLNVQAALRALWVSLTLSELLDLFAGGFAVEEVLEALGILAFERSLMDALSVSFEQVLDRSGRAAIKHFPVPDLRLRLRFDATNEESVLWIEQNAGRRVAQVSADTQRAIREVIRGSYTQPYTVVESAKRIRDIVGLTPYQAQAVVGYRTSLQRAGHQGDTVDRLTQRYHERLLRFRAEGIARTETINAAVAGQQELWEQSIRGGLIVRSEWVQEWIVTPDDRLCPSCRTYRGMRAPVGGMFPNGYSGPTAHTRCRCAVELRRVESTPREIPLPPEREHEPHSLKPRAPALR